MLQPKRTDGNASGERLPAYGFAQTAVFRRRDPNVEAMKHSSAVWYGLIPASLRRSAIPLNNSDRKRRPVTGARKLTPDLRHDIPKEEIRATQPLHQPRLTPEATTNCQSLSEIPHSFYQLTPAGPHELLMTSHLSSAISAHRSMRAEG